MIQKILLPSLMTLVLVGCSTTEEKYEDKSVGELYNTAMDKLQAGDFSKAKTAFEEVERQHPYSPWATRAQLMTAFVQYRDFRYDEAVGSLDAFIQLHPGNPNTAYAYYLKALCFYEQISPVEKDQAITERALQTLEEVVRRFPGTNYAKDARYKLDLAVDHLAGKEMEVGRYYLTMHQPIAALNRFRQVVDKYQTTTHVPEALHRLVEGYLTLGMRDNAQAAAAVLGHNFPDSLWYKDSYALMTSNNLAPDSEKAKSSWMGRAWGSRFNKVR